MELFHPRGNSVQESLGFPQLVQRSLQLDHGLEIVTHRLPSQNITGNPHRGPKTTEGVSFGGHPFVVLPGRPARNRALPVSRWSFPSKRSFRRPNRGPLLHLTLYSRSPVGHTPDRSAGSPEMWAHLDLNQGPAGYEPVALTAELWTQSAPPKGALEYSTGAGGIRCRPRRVSRSCL